jgi:hypothetical protein
MALSGGRRALVRASVVGEPSDLYLVDVRLSPEGCVLSVGTAWNITETTGVDESHPFIRGHRVLYTTAWGDLVTGAHVIDLAGSPPGSEAGFSRLQRVQAALTNWQQTGQVRGIAHTTFAFDPIAREASARWRDDGLIEANADGHAILLDPVATRVLAGDAYVRVVPDERARPGNLVTWAVDRVRAFSWFGDDRMQWVKAVAFTAIDGLHSVFGAGTTAEDVRGELGIPQTTPAVPGEPVAPDEADIGFPPAPIPPAVTPALPGEGRWIGLDHDAFITPSSSGSPPALVTSFVRPDPQRTDVRVYVTLWDPRQIELHIEAGTVEPISATGEHGPGLIPRAPEVMSRIVGAFNGGFQAQHGEYGMQANGIEYLPPKPYAATVLVLRDGSTAFGAWPESGGVPDDIVSFRQNLTALVQGGRFNPWGRNWWGGTPPGWPDQVHSTRSAICLTKENFVGYFYSMSISAEDLGRAMLASRCTFGIHLDMNPGHAGFEFYDIAPEGRLPRLERRLQPDWEAEGRVPDMPGYVFRARRMIRGMGHMLFPRYIQREARDFFYLTTRAVLPGAPLAVGASAEPSEGVWQTKGLPQHGFPPALATTSVVPDGPRGPRIGLLRVDPRAVAPEGRGPAGAPPVLTLVSPARGAVTLWWSDRSFVLAPDAPTATATPLAAGYALDDPRARGARAAAGVQGEDGVLLWAEIAPDAHPDASTPAALDRVLEKAGCSLRIGMPGATRAVPDGAVDTVGSALAPDAAPGHVARLVRDRAPDGHAIFSDTPIVGASIWQPLQAKRVRYLAKPPAPARLNDAGAGAAP